MARKGEAFGGCWLGLRKFFRRCGRQTTTGSQTPKQPNWNGMHTHRVASVVSSNVSVCVIKSFSIISLGQPCLCLYVGVFGSRFGVSAHPSFRFWFHYWYRCRRERNRQRARDTHDWYCRNAATVLCKHREKFKKHNKKGQSESTRKLSIMTLWLFKQLIIVAREKIWLLLWTPVR